MTLLRILQAVQSHTFTGAAVWIAALAVVLLPIVWLLGSRDRNTLRHSYTKMTLEKAVPGTEIEIVERHGRHGQSEYTVRVSAAPVTPSPHDHPIDPMPPQTPPEPAEPHC